MLYIPTFISVLEVLIVTVPVLLTVAFVTIAERKTMASMQRRLGPNAVGYLGLLQAFADALKLLLKEYIAPTQANIVLFFLGPIITLIFALLGYAVIPYGPGLSIGEFNLGIIYMLAVSSLSTYGILLAGWSANSKYAFLGSLRSTAQLISYELILSSAILLVVLLTGSLNLTVNIEAQRAIWFIVPLFPIFIIFFIGSIAETNRPPFDLAEAESELVSGFMTEHSAVIFVFFFLAEYASIVLICILSSVLFLGGYLFNFSPLIYLTQFIDFDLWLNLTGNGTYENTMSNSVVEGLVYGIVLGIKSCVLIFTFIWARASFPRIRFDQLMSFCWTVLLPVVIAFIVLVPCILYSFEIIPSNMSLLFLPLLVKEVTKDSVTKDSVTEDSVTEDSVTEDIDLTYREFNKRLDDFSGKEIGDRGWLSILISRLGKYKLLYFYTRKFISWFYSYNINTILKGITLGVQFIITPCFSFKLPPSPRDRRVGTSNHTRLLQSGYNYHLVTVIFLKNGNLNIYNYDKLVEYLNSLINQIDISKYNPANWEMLSPGKGGIYVPKMDILTPKISDWLDKLSTTVVDSGWSPFHIPNYHSIYNKVSSLLSQTDSPLFLLLGIFLCILVLFLIPGINTITKSLDTVKLKDFVSSNFGGIKESFLSGFDNLKESLPSYMVGLESSLEFIDFNNNITLLASLGLHILRATLSPDLTVYTLNCFGSNSGNFSDILRNSRGTFQDTLNNIFDFAMRDSSSPRIGRRAFHIWAEFMASLDRLEINIERIRPLYEELYMILLRHNMTINVSDVFQRADLPVIDVLNSNPNVSQELVTRVRNLHNTLRWLIRDIYFDLELLMGDYQYLTHLPHGSSNEYNDLNDPLYISESQRISELNRFIRMREQYINLVLYEIIPHLCRWYGNFNLFLP